MGKIQRILAPTDFSNNARLAVEEAISLASQLGAKVDVLTVNSRSYIRQAIKEGILSANDTDETLQAKTLELTKKRLADLVSQCSCDGVDIQAHIRAGDAGTEIIHFAIESRADMIVIGNYGIGGVRNILFGSAAEKVIRKSPCPVLLVPPKDKH